ncbi:hypothetical protein MAPG_04117 [Magnaporthiopsis poae ATCC 64411]|uniref:Uncharacterized protein n=1 Tax=Magnaporthiopsis poae (strain ATCC 64411 / 73-15) TaxID=644358 RepID=A0A0C4DVV4_MAGP6|nr:hypothetical protein MAPG_04117 [Magnaporthiopsis poae ATCC 64411]
MVGLLAESPIRRPSPQNTSTSFSPYQLLPAIRGHSYTTRDTGLSQGRPNAPRRQRSNVVVSRTTSVDVRPVAPGPQDVEMKRKIDDINDDDKNVAEAKDEKEINDRQEVAVDFENDNNDGKGFVNEIVIKPSENEADGEGESDAATDTLDGEAMIIDSAPQGKPAQDKSKNASLVPAREIDALYPNIHTQHNKTHAALSIFSGEPDGEWAMRTCTRRAEATRAVNAIYIYKL